MSKIAFLSTVLSSAVFNPLGVWAEESGSVLLVPSDHLDAHWIVEKAVAPEYPLKSLRKGEEGCVAEGTAGFDEQKREKLAKICQAAANKSLSPEASDAGSG
jgi:hypothetical protein